MNGALFFLAANFLVAAFFSALFAAVAKRCRAPAAALLLSAGFAIASLSAVCEVLVAYTDVPRLFAISAFASVLVGMVFIRAGVGELYGRRVRKPLAVAFVGLSVLLSYTIYGLPRGEPIQAILYQTPFAIAILSSAFVVLSSRRRLMIDRFLGGILLLTGLHFFAKAAMAVLVGAGSTARDYIHTNYALISQSATAVLIVAVGLTLLAVLVLEIMAAHQSDSETDALSGLANRRGFDRGVRTIFAAAPRGTHTVVVCDLDHFKLINDTCGHHVGDLVIQGFGRLLRRHAPQDAIVARFGGEEFAIFLPSTAAEVAVLFAQTLQSATVAMADLPTGLNVTASFGVSSLTSAGDLGEALRRADIALYEAKAAGRNRVKLADHSSDAPHGDGKGLRLVSTHNPRS
jgi:diguanylate cyclase (GGDEF)-like protein